MLPLIVSAKLAKGAIALSKQKVVVKRLNVIQNLGAIDVLCTDKTGTLTHDRVILEYYLCPNGVRDERVFDYAWLNSAFQSGMKNLLDAAVIEHGKLHKAHLPSVEARYRKVDEISFDFFRRRLSVVAEDKSGDHLMVCKGTVEEMLAMCTRVRDGDVTHPLDGERRDAVRVRADALNEDGPRVVLVATRRFDPQQPSYAVCDEADMTVEGMLTFLNPSKESGRTRGHYPSSPP